MNFSHYSDRPAELAVDLVNTVQTDGDRIASIKQLKTFLAGYEDLWHGVASPPKAGDLVAVHELRTALRDVLETDDEARASELINEILTEHGAAPRISTHSGTPHLHFEPIGTSISSWLGAITAMGLATIIIECGVERFGVCGASNCDDVYIDTSRNRSRRHCSSTCSTREAVAAYRARQSG
jgi:predicted RNA-binding Zn ribbon-like protein